MAKIDVKMRGPNSPATLSTHIMITGSRASFRNKTARQRKHREVPETTESADRPFEYAVEEELWKATERIERKIKIRTY